MPDPAKLAVLEGAKYELRETCFSCIHFVSPPPHAGRSMAWGSCSRIPSEHTKHTDGARLSVRLDGWCPAYEVTAAAGCDVVRSGFQRFIKP